jgi:hypothetical protein
MNSRPMEKHKVPSVRFICEQTGPSEAQLTGKLVRSFASGRLVERAYLVRVSFGDLGPTGVVLAIRTSSGGEEPSLLPIVGSAFASIFGPHEHLDIVFVREDQEKAIRQVCSEFYPLMGNGPKLS